MTVCRSCGTELSEDVNFCPNCGLRTEKGENDNVKTPVDRRPDWEKDLEYAIQNASKLLEEAVETAKKASTLFAADGWRIHKKEHYCPDCSKEWWGKSIKPRKTWFAVERYVTRSGHVATEITCHRTKAEAFAAELNAERREENSDLLTNV